MRARVGGHARLRRWRSDVVGTEPAQALRQTLRVVRAFGREAGSAGSALEKDEFISAMMASGVFFLLFDDGAMVARWWR